MRVEGDFPGAGRAAGNAQLPGGVRKLARGSGRAGAQLGGGRAEAEIAALDEATRSAVSTICRLLSPRHARDREAPGRQSPSERDRVRSLSPQSIEAMRAGLDATQVRLSQQLSSQMVLADDRHRRRTVPRTAGNRGRRHDHLRRDRRLAATSTSMRSRPASPPRSSPPSPASASRSPRCSATTT